MRKKEYHFNDGMSGIVLAKSLNQAIGIVSKDCRINKNQIRKELKGKAIIHCGKVVGLGDWFVDVYPAKVKGKSRILYWTE